MQLKNSHKAMSITLFIMCILVLMLLNVGFSLSKELPIETFVEVAITNTSENIDEINKYDETAKSTNQAFNTTKDYKQLAQIYKPIDPPKDYENPLLNRSKVNKSPDSKFVENESNNTLEKNELSAFEGVQAILSKHSKNSPENNMAESVNKNSTINYSLIGRTDTYLPVPIYLCESNGKVVVNITVNDEGFVTKTSINSSSSTQNDCLISHALEYAKTSRFNGSSKRNQPGTITFNFKGQ